MKHTVSAALLDPAAVDWPDQLRSMRRRLANRPTLLPHHFLEVVLPKIGGALYTLGPNRPIPTAAPWGYAFLLPRALALGAPVFTLRYERSQNAPALRADDVTQAVRKELPPHYQTVFYRPDAAQLFAPTHLDFEGVDCGLPDATEAAALRSMQQEIWRSAADGLYPADLHSADAGSGSSLVARVEGKVAGFLLGFYRFPLASNHAIHSYNQGLQLESQLLAVAPAWRGRRIGLLLKQLQARQALASGIDLINWTADPLLFPNALLNFTRLGAVAYEFRPGFYPFRNELNRVPASRLNLLWAVRSRRVQAALAATKVAGPSEIGSDRHISIVNQADRMPDFKAAAPRIAIEIPNDWIMLQRTQLRQAQRWRDVTNRLLGHYLGAEPGNYIITRAGASGRRRFLVGERVNDELLATLFAATK